MGIVGCYYPQTEAGSREYNRIAGDKVLVSGYPYPRLPGENAVMADNREVSDEKEIESLIAAWRQEVDDVLALVTELDDSDWSTTTVLPGWQVRDVMAHIAHLEAVQTDTPHDAHVEGISIGSPEHVRNEIGVLTEQGVVARRQKSPAELIEEFRQSARKRGEQLKADEPIDPHAPAPGTYGMIGWDYITLLRSRPEDLWMHEQDIRRAVDRPGNLDSPAARHAVAVLTSHLGSVLADKVKASPGTSMVVTVTGHDPVLVSVDDDGQGQVSHDLTGADANLRLEMDVETFVLLAGGRTDRDPNGPTMGPALKKVVVQGDTELGDRVLSAIDVTY